MSDGMAVKIFQRLTDFDDQTDASRNVRLHSIAVVVNGGTGDVFHDIEGPPVGCVAAVENPRDVRMIESRENLTLLLESLDDTGIGRAGDIPNHLDRDDLPEHVVVSQRQIDDPHSSTTKFPNDLVVSDLEGAVIWRKAAREKAATERLEHRGQLGRQRIAGCRLLIEEAASLVGGHRHGLIEQRAYPCVFFGRHARRAWAVIAPFTASASPRRMRANSEVKSRPPPDIVFFFFFARRRGSDSSANTAAPRK